MTLDRDAPGADQSPEVLHRVLDGLRRLPDQRAASERRDDDAAAPAPEGGDGVLPRRRR